MRILIQNGRVLDPFLQYDGPGDLLIEDGRVLQLERKIQTTADRVLDADGLWVVPGLIDMHVHFRDPGYTRKEDLLSGGRSALAGGFTTVACMPNTNPVCAGPEIVKYMIERSFLVHVLPVGSLSVDQQGRQLSDMKGMAAAGAVAFSEDGRTLADTDLFRQSMEKAAALQKPMLSHCEDLTLVAGGVINAGIKAQEFGLKGISNASETVIADRDIQTAAQTGTRLHLCHVSTAETVNVLAKARAAGQDVTGEVTPHHFTLTEEDIDRNWAGYKMNPPLRCRRDREALIEALRTNVITVIATDHAPHTREEKDTDFVKGANGIPGLETAVPLCITELVETGVLTPLEMISKLTFGPALVLNLESGTLKPGSPADVTLIDPSAEYKICGEQFNSKCKITPFEGRKVRGRVEYTIVNGQIRYDRGKVTV